MMNENNTQGTNNRFSYIDQKPEKVDAKAWFIAVLIFACLMTAFFAITYPPLSEVQAEKANAVSGQLQPKNIRSLSAKANVNTDTDTDVDEYTDHNVAFTVYEGSISDRVVVKPDNSGHYDLEPGKVYALSWDAAQLYEGMDTRVEIAAISDFLVKKDEVGIMEVSICDRNKKDVYAGEIRILPTNGNLGIEFCSRECRLCNGNGDCPNIRNGMFALYFYTAGEYAEAASGERSGADGMWKYEYAVLGDELQNCLVTKNNVAVEEPTMVASSDDGVTQFTSDDVPPAIPDPGTHPVPDPPKPKSIDKSPEYWSDELREESARILSNALDHYLEILGRKAFEKNHPQ